MRTQEGGSPRGPQVQAGLVGSTEALWGFLVHLPVFWGHLLKGRAPFWLPSLPRRPSCVGVPPLPRTAWGAQRSSVRPSLLRPFCCSSKPFGDIRVEVLLTQDFGKLVQEVLQVIFHMGA